MPLSRGPAVQRRDSRNTDVKDKIVADGFGDCCCCYRIVRFTKWIVRSTKGIVRSTKWIVVSTKVHEVDDRPSPRSSSPGCG